MSTSRSTGKPAGRWRVRRLLAGAALLAAAAVCPAQEAWVLIGGAQVPPLDLATVQRLYTGRAIEVAGTAITVIHAPEDSPLRARFLAEALKTDAARHEAYWTVRRHVGKGLPPRTVDSDAAVVRFIQSTPGGVGYISASALKAGMHVVMRPEAAAPGLAAP